ncbi:UNVERIFIED_ORG: type IV secretory pathway VirB6-like protein [Anoxybacillus amylolyticus]
MKGLGQLRKRGIVVFLLFLFFLSPFRAFAHDAVFLQVLIDKNTMQYQGNVVDDEANLWNLESKHMEAQLGDFSSLIQNPEPVVPVKGYKESSTDGSKEMPFTFPAKEVGGLFSTKEKNNAAKKDVERAYFIKETLIPGLNDALRVLNGGKPFRSVEELMNKGNLLSKGGRIGDYQVTYGKRASYSQDKPKLDKRTGISSSDYVVIRNVKNPKEEYEFVYRVPKGYSQKGSWDNDLYSKDLKGDADYITWHMLMYQAHYAYIAKGWTTKDVNEINRAGALEEAIVDLFENTFNTIRDLLGLYNLDELVFNDGIRGSALWQYGAIPKSWEDNVVTYHWVFQGLAWSLIAFAIVKQLIQKNLSTINPVMRVSLMESIQNLIVAGFLLASIFPLVNLLLYLNAKLVDVFAALAPDFRDLSGMHNYSNLLGGILIQFFYFFISLYLNALYVIRSISISLLIVAGPLFVLSLALGPKWSPLFGTWMRELAGNIFVQSFHAFMFSFFTVLTFSTRGIESLIVYFSVIPLTEFFRRLILGDSGIAGRLGLQSLVAGASVVGGATSSLYKDSGGKVRSGGSGGSSSVSEEWLATQLQSKASHYGQTATTSGKGLSHAGGAGTSQAGGYVQAKSIQDQHEIPLDIYTKQWTQQQQTGSDPHYVGETMSGLEAGMKDMGVALKHAASPSNLGKMASGLVSFAAGTGMSLAFGGVSPLAMYQGMAMASKGLSQAVQGVQEAGASLKRGMQSLYQGTAMDYPAPSSSATPDDSLFLEDYSHIRQGANGQIHVYRDGQILSQAGIVRGGMDDQGNAVYVYDVNKLHAQDRANIERYAQLYQQGAAEQAWLSQQGIARVSRDAQGHYVVAYNDTGKEALGIRSVRMVGGQLMETKSSFQPFYTKKTLDLPSYPQGQSQISQIS